MRITPVAIVAVIAAVLVSYRPAAAQDATDLLRDAVDPYIAGKERARFLRAAGADSELSEEELTADAAQADGFVRPFDKWATLLLLDRNKNGAIDWFEADSYRKAVRAAVVRQYDANGDGKLTGDERDEANKALAAGKLPKVDPSAQPTQPGLGGDNPFAPGAGGRGRRGGERREQFIQRFDADGDGKLSPEEERTAGSTMIREGRDQMVKRFDNDGDGKLNDAERAAVMADRQAKWWLKIDDLGMKHFDADGDGVLSEAESRDIVAFGEKLRDLGKQWELTALDTNGDGEVSQEERQAMQGKVQLAGLSMLPKAIKWADANGDGQVSQEEREAVAERVAKQAEINIKKWTDRFDNDHNGRLDANERDALVKGIDEDARARYKRHDADGDGQLSSVELQTLFEELAEEWAVKPAGN